MVYIPAACQTRPFAVTARSAISGSKRNAVVSMAARALVPIANGSEEMEAVITIDVFRRAKLDVTVASVEDSLEVKASRDVRLTADENIASCKGAYDVIALPVRVEWATAGCSLQVSTGTFQLNRTSHV